MCSSPTPSFTKGNTRRSIPRVEYHHDVSIRFKDSIVNNRNRYSVNQRGERRHPTKPPNGNVIILATVDSQGKFSISTKIVLRTWESMWGSRDRILGIPWAHEWHGCKKLSCRRIVDLAIGQVTNYNQCSEVKTLHSNEKHIKIYHTLNHRFNTRKAETQMHATWKVCMNLRHTGNVGRSWASAQLLPTKPCDLSSRIFFSGVPCYYSSAPNSQPSSSHNPHKKIQKKKPLNPDIEANSWQGNRGRFELNPSGTWRIAAGRQGATLPWAALEITAIVLLSVVHFVLPICESKLSKPIEAQFTDGGSTICQNRATNEPVMIDRFSAGTLILWLFAVHSSVPD